MKHIKRRYRKYMKTHNRNLFLIEITFMVLFTVFILPLINMGVKYCIFLWGKSYITYENLGSFLVNPPTLFFLCLLILLLSFFILFQLITMTCYSINESENRRMNLLNLILIGLMKLKRCLQLRNIALPFYIILYFLFTNIPLLLVITLRMKTELPVGNTSLIIIKIILLLSYALLAMIAFRGLFVIQFFINEHLGFYQSLKQSVALLKGRTLKAVKALLCYNLITTVCCIAIYYLVLTLAAIFVFLTVERPMVITVFLSLYPRLNGTLFIVFHMIFITINMNVINSLYADFREEELADILTDSLSEKETVHLVVLKKHRRSIAALFLFVLAIGLLNSYITIRNDSFYLEDALSGIQISSHRGNSHVAPENTLPALESAILARSDIAEIDVRQTKDGVIVLLHDKNLIRTAGVDAHVWSLTYQEIKLLDAGSWFGDEFAYTYIPTLEEAFELCKGKIKLNIEVKSDYKSPDLEEKLVALIEEYDFENQCLISSYDYRVLDRIKMLNKNLKTGLIISAAYGNYYKKEDVDFFSIRSNYITKQAVINAHLEGKEVHAWTVNSAREIERMKSVGVDCIITDNPTLTREILYQDDTSKTFIELLNHMLKTRRLF